MKVLGKGEARGGVSILHALGTGKGCSIGVNLLTRVELIDKKYENSQDEHNLLKSVIECWKEAGFPVPSLPWIHTPSLEDLKLINQGMGPAVTAYRLMCESTLQLTETM